MALEGKRKAMTVIITGYSNMTSCRQAVEEWVEEGAKSQIGAFPGQTGRTVF